MASLVAQKPAIGLFSWNNAHARYFPIYQLAQRSGISYSTIKTTEKRGGQLKIDTIERICAALGITLRDFFAEP